MTQYSTLNVKFSTSQLNKLKSEIKIGADITLKFHGMLLVILMMKLLSRICLRISLIK